MIYISMHTANATYPLSAIRPIFRTKNMRLWFNIKVRKSHMMLKLAILHMNDTFFSTFLR